MADRLRTDTKRLLAAALESGGREEVHAFLRRLNHRLDQRPRGAGGGRSSPVPREAPDWVRHTALARELGIDPRTLWTAVAKAPYARQVSERIKIIHRPKFYAELERGLRLPAGRGR